MSAQLSENLRPRLLELRRGLLHLHKILLDAERAVYEQTRGRVSSGELLQLLIKHEQFAWLHPFSELIVRIDEMLDSDEPLTADDGNSLFAQARSLRPAENGSVFEQRFFATLQREPAAVLALADVTNIVSRNR